MRLFRLPCLFRVTTTFLRISFGRLFGGFASQSEATISIFLWRHTLSSTSCIQYLNLSVIFLCGFSCVKYVFHSFVGLMIKIFLSSFKIANSVLPRNSIPTDRRAKRGGLHSLQFPFWCSILELVRTHFAAAGGETANSGGFAAKFQNRQRAGKTIGSNHVLTERRKENF